AWLRGLAHTALATPAVAHLASRLPHRVVLVADAERVTAVDGTGDGATVSAHAPMAVWREMMAALPPPGRQSMGAAMRADCGFELRGEALAIAQSIPLLELLLEAMRIAANESTGAGDTAAPVALERLASRYLRIDWPAGDHCWIFEEAAGDP